MRVLTLLSRYVGERDEGRYKRQNGVFGVCTSEVDYRQVVRTLLGGKSRRRRPDLRSGPILRRNSMSDQWRSHSRRRFGCSRSRNLRRTRESKRIIGRIVVSRRRSVSRRVGRIGRIAEEGEPIGRSASTEGNVGWSVIYRFDVGCHRRRSVEAKLIQLIRQRKIRKQIGGLTKSW